MINIRSQKSHENGFSLPRLRLYLRLNRHPCNMGAKTWISWLQLIGCLKNHQKLKYTLHKVRIYSSSALGALQCAPGGAKGSKNRIFKNRLKLMYTSRNVLISRSGVPGTHPRPPNR